MTITLGVIGTGAIGREHIRRCSQVLQGAQVVAVTDVNQVSAQSCVEQLQLDAKVYPSGEALIQQSQVDAVLVTCWDKSHEAFVLQALAAEKYVFCEKPLAVTAAGCQHIVDAEMRLGQRRVQVGFMRRYDKGYQALKSVIDGGEIGQPLLLHGAHRNVCSGEHYSTDMAITNTLIHEIDVHRWLLDDDYASVQVVFPRATSYAPQRLRDPQMVLFETEKGRRIDMEVFVNCQYGYDIQCQVVGEKGTARLPDPLAIPVRQQAKLSTALLTDWQERFIEAYDIELQAFINDVTHCRLTGPSAWDGLMAAVTADACIIAQENGEIVPIHTPSRPAFYQPQQGR